MENPRPQPIYTSSLTSPDSTPWLVESGYHLVRRSMVKRRKSKVLPPPSGCPLSRCMRLLGGAWTAHVIWYLREGERCFTELQVDIGGVSDDAHEPPSQAGKRRDHRAHPRRTSPPTVWYSLTPVGQELCGALTNVIHITQRLKGAPFSLGRIAFLRLVIRTRQPVCNSRPRTRGIFNQRDSRSLLPDSRSSGYG